MDSKEAISALTSLQGQTQNQADALKVALDLLTNGYQTDEVAKKQAIDEGITAALAPVQSAISGLTASIANVTPMLATAKAALEA